MYQREFMENSVENMKPDWLTLLFTCNGVGVVIRSVRLKIWSSENSILKKKMETFWFFWLWFCHTYDFASNSNFWFSLSHKHSCGSPYDFDSDFAASENQPLLGNSRKYPYQTTDVFNVLSPPCLRKFQNVLPPMPSEFHNREPPLPFRISVFLEVHFRLSNAYMNKRTWIYASSRLWSSGARRQALL